MNVLRCALLLLAAVQTRGFVTYVQNGHPLRWNMASSSAPTNCFNPTTHAIRFYIASDAYSQANRAAELNAVRSCFAQWQAVSGTTLKFEDAGLSPDGGDLNVNDHTNMVFWCKSGACDFGLNITGLLGYTLVGFNDLNEILEADTVLNGYENQWFTEFAYTARADRFVEATALHEIGHFIGLDHTPLGAATVTQSGSGVNTAAGLSSDEIQAVRYLYGTAAQLSAMGTISGKVTRSGLGILGAVVFAEDAAGNAIEGTVTISDGTYSMPALPPGRYLVRASPLDPDNATFWLKRGRDIAGNDYRGAIVDFLPSASVTADVSAGGATTINIAVAQGTPLRITAISPPTQLDFLIGGNQFATTINRGAQGYYVGVLGVNLPSDAVLRISGDGLTVGSTRFTPKGGQNALTVPISVAANATPGMRTFIVQQGNNLAYAPGYLEVMPDFPDYNFDGLDDFFQRRYFPLFTAPEAAPTADPDGDKFSNAFEYRTGTNPTDSNSVQFHILSVRATTGGATVVWESDPGKKFQLYGKNDAAGAGWATVGGVVTATGTTTSAFEPGAGLRRFYKVVALP